MALRYRDWFSRARGAIEGLGQSMPMVSYKQYRSRNAQLRKDGFLPTERFWLAAHDIESPAMRLMRQERREMKSEFMAYFSWNQFQGAISRMYDRNGWFFRRGGANPFAMLEEYKRRYNMPDTPQAKRRVPDRDFIEGKARTMRRLA